MEKDKDDLTVASRRGAINRETGETRISIELGIDGTGQYSIDTGQPMFDHMLAQLSRHGLIDAVISAKGDDLPDAHHLIEDVAIAAGRALRQAIGEGKGIRRMGSALVPLDEALARVVVDVGGRGYAVVETQLEGARFGNIPGELVGHFFQSFAIEGGINIHASILAGVDPHHKAEALFKALGRSLRVALEPDSRLAGAIPSTKGTISG